MTALIGNRIDTGLLPSLEKNVKSLSLEKVET